MKAIVKGIEVGKYIGDMIGSAVGLLLMKKDYYFPDDPAILLPQTVEKEKVPRGAVVAKLGTIKAYFKFKAMVFVLEEFTTEPIESGHYDFWIRVMDFPGTLTAETKIAPGTHGEVLIELDKDVALEKHQRFAIRKGQKTIAAACIFELIE